MHVVSFSENSIHWLNNWLIFVQTARIFSSCSGTQNVSSEGSTPTTRTPRRFSRFTGPAPSKWQPTCLINTSNTTPAARNSLRFIRKVCQLPLMHSQSRTVSGWARRPSCRIDVACHLWCRNWTNWTVTCLAVLTSSLLLYKSIIWLSWNCIYVMGQYLAVISSVSPLSPSWAGDCPIVPSHSCEWSEMPN